ncbi:hypothetical protein SAMN04515617_12527 [Collimonas sp. OK242]|jgi:hypothetical protein|nr:hypothetical protein [Collimonas sp. OK242]SDY85711.1 hypothetical protein SAMN04515617_12527 [Collimonas sp. OK242]
MSTPCLAATVEQFGDASLLQVREMPVQPRADHTVLLPPPL